MSIADIKRVIDIVFESNAKDAASAIKTLSHDIKATTAAMGDISQPLAAAHDQVVKLEAALATLAIGGLAYSVNEYRNFEDVMLKVKGIIQASEEEYQQLIDLTKSLGATTRYTSAEAAQGLEFLALAGLNTNDALAALPVTLNLAQAAAISLGASADIVTNIMAGYGIAIKDLEKTADVLTATFTNSNTNLEELGQAFKYVGPVAKTLGLDIEEVAAALGVLADGGYKADMGGTALRNILIALVSPTRDFEKLAGKLGIDVGALANQVDLTATTLKALGVNAKDSSGNLRPLPDIMDQLRAGLDKIPGSADQAAILMDAFGKRGGPQMAALLNQGSDSVRELEEKIRGLGGVTGDIAKQMESGIGGALRELRSGFQAMTLEIGAAGSSQIDPAIRGLTELFRAVADEIGKGSFDAVFDSIGELSTRLGDQLKGIAQNLPAALDDVDFSRLAKSIEGLGEETGDLFRNLLGDVDLTTVKGVREALERIVNVITALTETTTGIVKGWQPWAKLLGDTVGSMGELETGTNETIGRVLQLGKGINVLAGFLNDLTGGLDGIAVLLKLIYAKKLVETVAGMVKMGAASGNLAGNLAKLSGSAAGQAGLLGLAAALGWTAETIINDHVPAVGKASQAILGWADSLLDFTGTQDAANREAETFAHLIESLIRNADKFNLSKLREQLQALGHDLTGLSNADTIKLAAEVDLLSFEIAQEIIKTSIPEEKKIEVSLEGIERTKQHLLDMGHDLSKIPKEKIIELALDDTAMGRTRQALVDLGYDLLNLPGPVTIPINVTRDEATIEWAHAALAALPVQKIIELALARDDYSFTEIPRSIQDIPDQVLIELALDMGPFSPDRWHFFDDLPPVTINVTPKVDLSTLTEAQDKIATALPDGRTLTVTTLADGTTMIETVGEINKNIPGVKKVDVKAEADKEALEKVKSIFDVIKESIQWKAKLEITELETNAKKVEAIMAGVTTLFESGGVIISSGLEAMVEASGSRWLSIKKIVEEEHRLRERGLVVQEKMADAEIKLMEARAQALAKGDALITVTGDGLAPHLEAMMFSVLEAVQVRANATEQDFLLGLPQK